MTKKYADQIEQYTDDWGNARVRITEKWLQDNAYKAELSQAHSEILRKAAKLGYVSVKMYKVIHPADCYDAR